MTAILIGVLLLVATADKPVLTVAGIVLVSLGAMHVFVKWAEARRTNRPGNL